MRTFKEVIEEHPLILIILACVGTAATSVASVSWFWKQSEALQQREFRADLNAVERKHADTVSDLKSRLVSIERRIGDEELYLDVAKIPIQSALLPSIASTHTAYSHGQAYLHPPTFQEWKENGMASQLDLIAPIFGKKFMESESGQMISQLFAGLSEIKGTLWVSNDTTRTYLTSDSPFFEEGETELIESSPFVLVLPIDDNFFAQTAAAIGGAFDDIGNDLKEINDRIERLLSSIENNLADDGELSRDQNIVLGSSSADHQDELLEYLEQISRGDLAGLILWDSLSSSMMFSQFLGGSFEVVSAQKKGNVSYLRVQISVDNAASRDTGGSKTTIFDLEYFFIGTGSGGVMIRSFVPSENYKTEAYAWTQGLLTSLRVPVR